MPVVSHSQKRKKWLTSGVQVERAVRLRAVQEDRDAGDGDVGQHQRDDDVAPPRQRHQAVRGEDRKSKGIESSKRPECRRIDFERAIIRHATARCGDLGFAIDRDVATDRSVAAAACRAGRPRSPRRRRLPAPSDPDTPAAGTESGCRAPGTPSRSRRLIALRRLSWPFSGSLIQSPELEVDAAVGEADDEAPPAGSGVVQHPRLGPRRARPSAASARSTSLS